MSRLLSAVIGLIFASATACAVAEPRFYQVIDSNGRMQTILASDDEPSVQSSASSAQSEMPVSQSDTEKKEEQGVKPVASAPVTTAPLVAPEPAASAVSSVENTVQAESPEEGYIDSEELERSHFNPTKKKRFYTLNDGMGSRVEESDGQLTGVVENGPGLFPQATEEPFRELDSRAVEVTDRATLESLIKVPTSCLNKPARQKAHVLSKGIPQSLIINHKTRTFVGVHGVVEAYKVGGEGLRRLSLHAYAKSDKKPSFIMPVIALADENGCVVRVLTGGYYETWYAATKTRQHHLEGSLIMSSAERFLVVLLPALDSAPAETSFPLTHDGMFAVKWHE